MFPLGTHVYREPCVDLDGVIRDLQIVKDHGFNLIKIQQTWSTDERIEGKIDLGRIERIIQRAGELDLGVYLGLTMEQAPAWFWRKFPDASPVAANGLRVNDPTQYCLPGDGKPGPCWHHPQARLAAERFIAGLVQRLSPFDNIWVWNVWQEIGFGNGPPGLCYCEHTLDAFRSWLKTRYESIEALNRAWLTGFGNWEEVEPSRGVTSVPITIDWRYFMDNVYLSEVLAWKTRAIKANDKQCRPVFSHIAIADIGRGSDWRWADSADFFGDSKYPGFGVVEDWAEPPGKRTDRGVTLSHEICNYFQLNTDYVRSAARGRKIWAAEFQGGPISSNTLYSGRVPDGDDIRRWMLGGLAAGLNGISFWNHRAETFWGEGNGFGLLDPRGDSTPRIREAGRVGAALNRFADLFSRGETVNRQVAILVNDDLYHFAQASGGHAPKHLSFGIRGHYARLWHMGIWVDFVDAQQVMSGELRKYKAAILPVPFSLDGGLFAHLADYVKEGGMLISDASPGRFDRYGFCPRKEMVRGGEAVFGVAHEHLHMVREPEDGHSHWTPREKVWGDFLPATIFEGIGSCSGAKLRASVFVQTLKPITAETILGLNGATVGSLNVYGKGTAILIGTFAGHSFSSHALKEPENLFNFLLSRAGVEGETFGGLLRRRRAMGRLEAWFLMNVTPHILTETIPLEGHTLVSDLLNDTLIESNASSVSVRVSPYSLGCLVVRS